MQIEEMAGPMNCTEAIHDEVYGGRDLVDYGRCFSYVW